MNTEGVYYSFLATLSWSICVFPFTLAARKLGPSPLNHLRLLMAVAFLTITLLFINNFNFSIVFQTPNPEQWLWFGISGIIGLMLGDYFGFYSYAILGTRFGSIFTTLAPIAALSGGMLLVNEKINATGIAGIVITISGVGLVALSKKEKGSISDQGMGTVNKGIFYGILSACCQGLGVVLANKGFNAETSTTLHPVHATWIRMIIATTCIFAVTIIKGDIKKIAAPVLNNNNKGNYYALLGTLFGPFIGVSLSMKAIQHLNNHPGIAQTIFSLVPVFVLPIAFFFQKEKLNVRSVTGAIIAVLGVMLLINRDKFIL